MNQYQRPPGGKNGFEMLAHFAREMTHASLHATAGVVHERGHMTYIMAVFHQYYAQLLYYSVCHLCAHMWQNFGSHVISGLVFKSQVQRNKFSSLLNYSNSVITSFWGGGKILDLPLFLFMLRAGKERCGINMV